MLTRRAHRRLRAPRNGWLVGLGIVMILGLFLVSTNASALYAATPTITSLTPPATLHVDDGSPAGFDIPYIQASTTLTVAVGATGVPSGGGVEIVVDGASSYDLSAPYQLSLTVRPGEHRVEAYLVRADRTRLPNPEAHVARGPIGVGAIYTTIGDSITAGMYGDRSVTAVEGCADSPHSADCRNFYQHNPSDGVWYRGYQVRLNDCLTGATGAATFLLNEGYGGLTSAQILGRMPSYRVRVQRLGVSGALLLIGVNDVSHGVSADEWQRNVERIIVELRDAGVPASRIWLASLPYRDGTRPGALAKRRLTQAYNERIPTIASKTGVRVGPDFYSYFEQHQDQMADKLHPNATGYSAMAGLWTRALTGSTRCGP